MPFVQSPVGPLSYSLRRSRRARRLHMACHQQQFEIVAPSSVSNQQILQFMFANKSWMVKQKKHHHHHPSWWPSEWQAGEKLMLQAKALRLNIKYGATYQVTHADSHLSVQVPWSLPFSQLNQAIGDQIIHWYQQKAKTQIDKALHLYCPQLKRWPEKVQLKQQKTRWGSCSHQGNIYINWLLVLAPAGTLEYVVAHELCHLFHRNHGVRFWQKVAGIMPDYQIHETWLKRHGRQLQPPFMV